MSRNDYARAKVPADMYSDANSWPWSVSTVHFPQDRVAEFAELSGEDQPTSIANAISKGWLARTDV
ncbi:hypothetical protein [Burkholderia sp.]|uniref:hypothetical protein n=1 Tax=Burkholderia sp. TaxID=36773 RepID=UPI0025BEE874|nr:hypothetical protein [Burkholderia sp.]MBS6359837.1 hypothetical protein [Burkholderia sp.]